MGKNAIVLTGMPGAGKSTVGILLAKELGYSFVDVDEYIIEKERAPLQEIINRRGEEYLIKIEKEAIYDLELKRRVVSPGGSIILYENVMEYLRGKALIVFLNNTFENIQSRLTNAELRGIVGLRDKTLGRVYEERNPLYRKYADFTVDARNKAPDEIVREISDYYSKENYAL
jgi:shikimate kinase